MRIQGVIFLAATVASASLACKKDAPAGDRPAGLPAAPAGLPAAPAAPAAAPPGAAVPAPAEPMASVPPGEMPGQLMPSEMEPGPPPDPRHSVSGTIELPFKRRGDVGKGDVMFLIARRPSPDPKDPKKEGALVASKKLEALDFPTKFVLSAEDVMNKGTPFEGPLVLTVRVDKDGDPMTRRKGDVVGVLKDVKLGAQNLKLSLDTVLTEDQTLGGMPPMGAQGAMGAIPPGHPMPAGHGTSAGQGSLPAGHP